MASLLLKGLNTYTKSVVVKLSQIEEYKLPQKNPVSFRRTRSLNVELRAFLWLPVHFHNIL